MKKAIIIGLFAAACGVLAPQAAAQRFAIKGYDNLGLGNAMSVDKTADGQTSKSSVNAFGLDFGYTFWRKGGSSLEANIGFGYIASGTNIGIGDMSYHYSAPALADEDGNPYERYYELSGLKQKLSMGSFQVPIYLDYQFKPIKWLGLHAMVGVGLGFALDSTVKTGDVSGTAKAWGVFPEYDDLLIDQDYLDDFGVRSLSGSGSGAPDANKFAANLICGAGLEFYTYQPVSFEVGVRYNYGLTNAFKGMLALPQGSEMTAETAPVTYTVADGTQVRSLADYTGGGRLSALSLHLGVNIRF